MVPGLLTIESPTRAANPDRGCTNPTIPSGMATAIPVRTSARCPGRQLDVFCAVEIDAGITVVGAAGQRKPRVETNNRQTGRHGATDYP